MTAHPFPPQFKRETHTINGVKTVLLAAGSGEPLVFLHGAGIWHGVNFALPWTEKFRVIIPFHPGFAESGDGAGWIEHHIDDSGHGREQLFRSCHSEPDRSSHGSHRNVWRV